MKKSQPFLDKTGAPYLGAQPRRAEQRYSAHNASPSHIPAGRRCNYNDNYNYNNGENRGLYPSPSRQAGQYGGQGDSTGGASSVLRSQHYGERKGPAFSSPSPSSSPYAPIRHRPPCPEQSPAQAMHRPTQQAQPIKMQIQCCVNGKRRKRSRAWLAVVLVLAAVLALAAGIWFGVQKHRKNEEIRTLAKNAQNNPIVSTDRLATSPVTTIPPDPEPPEPAAVMALSSGTTMIAGEEIKSTHAILMDVASGASLCERLPDERIYPASMTKVMTLIVAYENLPYDQTFTFTADLINPLVKANASRAGFSAGETVSVVDLLYAAALPSGADATSALAILTAGSEEAFAEKMNAKAAEMGLSETHFVNASGLHDDAHYSTVREIAAIFTYAMQIEPLREILSTYQYTTSATPEHPDGMLLTSTMFANLSGNELPGMTIIAGKTGYTLEARRCLVSCAVDSEGREYIAVVVGGDTQWVPITDSVELYAMCLNAPTQ